ncbi:hypothetical protein E3O45_03820 [Cryobacterium sp. TMS1-20-1]|uniref:hypothetical protein n=1 Tax=Cryobacterium sp. TMS1-20-1 TaxID=1259223 RepID=UPI00106C6F84|nr:hypothetical protein [Cryobacterium sp. TMS1-20-1]TFC79415.1 hypothetical protein E3O45_03820 [Cryobacterium sp. TMS1-20-1]
MTEESNGDNQMVPIAIGALIKVGEAGQKFADSAAVETGGLLRRILGPSADVIGQDWADRLRRKNMERLLVKTEKHAGSDSDPGWAQPRVAAAVFEAAQYADEEIVTDYLSGVLASARKPDGGNDDALPWSNLISRLSALQLRAHYLIYLNLRQVVKASGEKTRLYEFKSREVAFPMEDFLEAVGLDRDGSDFYRLADALQGMSKEDLIDSVGYGDRDFFSKHSGNLDKQFKFLPRKRLSTPFDQQIQITFSSFGVQFFLWGLGFGMSHDTAYLDSGREFLIDSDSPVTNVLIEGVDFVESYWVELDDEGNPAGAAGSGATTEVVTAPQSGL